VDDQDMARRAIEMLLLEEGYQLHFADNGPDALSKAMKVVPDLILLDVMMPGMDGFEVCRRLRTHQILAEVPILMLTALNDRKSRLQGITAGADDFISKPFDLMELKMRVQSIMRLNRYRRLLVERVRFRWVVDNAEEGYLIVDEEGIIVYANPRARFYFGLSESDMSMVKFSFLELAQGHYHCEPQEAWANWPAPPIGNVPRYLVRPETENARSFWLQVDILNLPAGPGVIGTLRLRDVTDRMNTLRDMRSFNASITHKLLTPLVHMTGNLELLAKYYRTEMSNPDIAELFEVAHSGSLRLKQEINEIIQYTRNLPLLTKGEEAFHLEALASTVEALAAELTLDKVHASCEGCAADTRAVLSNRATTLILTELLENAQKFHPQHTPTVEVVASCQTPGELCLRVANDGPALSPEQLVQVWTPYYQAEKHFTGEVLGMGLGLTMVSTLVWSVGGTCRIYNRSPGPGVEVELKLPLA